MKTAVVILNWNGVHYLQKFLPTLEAYTTTAQIVVIDNNSTDTSLAYLKENHPSVRLVINKENGGFAQGYNDGLEQLKGEFDYYVLINSDIEVTPNWLEPLVEKLDSDSSIAGVQPKVLAYNSKGNFEHAGASGGFIDRNFYPFCRGRIFHVLEEDKGQYDGEIEVFWTTGACMIVRAEVYHKLGGLDSDFFAHQEEIDFCWRAKRHGYSFWAVPKSKVFHVGGGTLDYENPRKTYLNFRNNLYMIHKNYEGFLFGKIFYRMILDGVAGAKFALTFKFPHVAAILKAHFSYYGQLSNLNRKRKKLKETSTNFNPKGWYKASILWAFYFKGIKSFDELNKRFLS